VSAEHRLHIMTANRHKPAIWIFYHGRAFLQIIPQNRTQQSLHSWSKVTILPTLLLSAQNLYRALLDC